MKRKKIPIDKIRIDEEIVKMMASDRWWKDAQHELLKPIVVCKIDDEKYEIVDGLRRYHAFNELNKKHPNEDWDKIPAIIGDDYEKF